MPSAMPSATASICPSCRRPRVSASAHYAQLVGFALSGSPPAFDAVTVSQNPAVSEPVSGKEGDVDMGTVGISGVHVISSVAIGIRLAPGRGVKPRP